MSDKSYPRKYIHIGSNAIEIVHNEQEEQAALKSDLWALGIALALLPIVIWLTKIFILPSA